MGLKMRIVKEYNVGGGRSPEQTMLVISQEYPRLIPYSRRRVVFKLLDYLLRDTAASRLKIVVMERRYFSDYRKNFLGVRSILLSITKIFILAFTLFQQKLW